MSEEQISLENQNAVYVNSEFNEKTPIYYIDSGVVIAFSLIKLLKENGESKRDIKRAMIKANPHNIDYDTAEILYNLYEQNMRGEVAFFIPPTVYKETMIDSRRHDDLSRQYTRKFVTENCFLVFPNESIESFARKTAALQNKLKSVQSPSGVFGLNVEMKKRKNAEGIKVPVDENLEDRLILSQIAVMTKQGKQQATIISCSSNLAKNDAMVQSLFDEEKRIDDSKSIPKQRVEASNPGKVTFIQINSRDFGTKICILGSTKDQKKGKKSVAEQLEDVLDVFFEGKGSMVVRTPLELE